ncbi:MAG TPA: hypothetical protein VGP82_01580 [Ktedonobacterales bacterium]|jgi:hypothetical protein|nr:hypothetical protein [Ktedonobacterales bacterium]
MATDDILTALNLHMVLQQPEMHVWELKDFVAAVPLCRGQMQK